MPKGSGLEQNLTAVDLFAGAGGLSLGFMWAGIRITGAVETDKWAAETFATNLPDTQVFVGDMRTLDPSSVPEPDFLIGGPPCQGFSHSNIANKDPRDPRNSLFEDFIRFAAACRPRMCLIENVKGLLRTRTATREKVIDVIVTEFARIGYQARYTILEAADYGVPQFRERLFIVAVPEGSAGRFHWPTPTHRHDRSKAEQAEMFSQYQGQLQETPRLWDAISDLPQTIHESYDPESSYRSPPLNWFQVLMRDSNLPSPRNHEPMRHTPRTVQRFQQISYGQSEADVPERLKPNKRRAANGRGRAYHQNSRRQRPDRPCNTIVASSHTNFIHPFLHRNFTVRELARVQSFPDSFVFRGKRAVLSHRLLERKGLHEDIALDQRVQIGNAVPPLLAKVIADEMVKTVRHSSDAATTSCAS